MTIEYKDSKRIVATSITTSIQGNNGGSGQHSSGAWAGSGGGGGSSSVGANSSTSAGGNGGNGTANTISGSSITYATGGAGSGNASDGTGGSSNANNNNVGQSATANRGSGGGAAKNGTQGGAGSSGIVVIRFTTSGNTYSQSGGTVTTSGSDTIISYTTTSGTKTFSPTSSFNVQYLIVGGGGSAGAGNEPTGAGGAGGYLAGTGHGVTAQSYSITVGAGGAQPSTTAGDLGNDGSNSRFEDFIGIGGGSGGGRSNTESIRKGRDGGSGGGSGTDVAGSSGATTGGSATTQTITERPTNVQDNSILIEKNTARRYWFALGTSATDEVTSGTTDAGFNTNIKGFGNKVQAGDIFVGKKITKLSLEMKNNGSAVGGNITFGVFNTTSSTPVFTFGTFAASTLTSSYQYFEQENLTGHTLTADQVLGFHASGDVSNLNLKRYNGGTGARSTLYGMYWATSGSPNWQNAGDHQDANMKVSYVNADTWTLET